MNMAWAYVKDGVVIDRFRVDPYTIFYPEYAQNFIEAPDDVDHYWTFDGTTWSPPAIDPNQLPLQIRAQRNQLLQASDWTQATDVPNAFKNKWVAYRQALRDVPQQQGFPNDVVWPIPPQ